MWRLALAFVCAFTVDVRVRAAQTITLPLASRVVEQPENCLQTAKSCAIRTGPGVKWVLELSEQAQVVMGPDTTVVRINADRVRLVSGFMWVQAKKPVQVETEYGVARSTDFWVLREAGQMTVRASQGDVDVAPRGVREHLQVLSGMQNWIGQVGPGGEARTGFPQAIVIEDHVRRWAQLRTGEQEKFREEFEKFVARWEPAVEQASEWSEQVASRAIAEDAEKKRLQTLARERARKEAAEIRAMFRRNNYLDL